MLEKAKPEQVFHFFEELSKIPRCSGNEKQVSDYLVSFAKKRDLEVFQDEALNVIIKKPGTKGYKQAQTVIIQGHMDMVGEKSKTSKHDFAKDPLILVKKGDILHADGTTLGADNGIAVAYGLALLDSKLLSHPPLEILVTTNEETGMDGAIALKTDQLAGKILLNIDAEEEGSFFVSCAGGVNHISQFTLKQEKSEQAGLHIHITGLKGGHSGMEIIKQRASAIKLMGRILVEARKSGFYHISEISGGSKSNAIARDAQVTLTADPKTLKKIRLGLGHLSKALKTEFEMVDPDLQIVITSADAMTQQFDRASTDQLVDFLAIVPHGVQTMSNDLEGLVESSLNLGTLEQSGKSIKLTISVRSSVESIMEDIISWLDTLAKVTGAKSTLESRYPAWQFEEESKIRDLCVKVYKKMSGQDPQIKAIHAGLECGILKQKLPQTDMISFGPNLYNVHTPEEHLSIKSVSHTWEFLKEILVKLK